MPITILHGDGDGSRCQFRILPKMELTPFPMVKYQLI